MSKDQKVAVLTGGGGIIGKAAVQALTRDGFFVAVVDRDAEPAAQAAMLAHGDGAAEPFHYDISDKEQIIELRETLIERFGKVDALLCNAATKSDNIFEPFETFPLEDWNYVLGVNLTSAMLTAQAFAPGMAKVKGASIVNTLSIYGITAPDQRIYDGAIYEGRAINTPAVYSASKAGLWGLTQYLASYYGEQGLRVNAVTPGGVFSGQNDQFVKSYSHRTMMGRMAEPHEIADAMAFLVSSRASYITGQNIVVDGGLTAW